MQAVSRDHFFNMVSNAIRCVQEQLVPYSVTILGCADAITWLPTSVVQQIKASNPAFGADELCVIDVQEARRLLVTLENGELDQELSKLLPKDMVLVDSVQ
jgi:hypothetical protein